MPRKKSTESKKEDAIERDLEPKVLRDLLEKTILQDAAYKPLSEGELFRLLKIPSKLLKAARSVVSLMVEEGRLCWQENLLAPAETSMFLTGMIRLHPKGFGFVVLDSPSTFNNQDVFIPRKYAKDAVDGDGVEVEVFPSNEWERGPEGRVVQIVRRTRSTLAGIVTHFTQSGDLMVYVPLLGGTRPVLIHAQPNSALNVGDRIIMRVISWGEDDRAVPVICEVLRSLGHISEPIWDIPAALEEFNIKEDFPPEAQHQAKVYGTKVLPRDLVGREDLTGLECVTIDPDTAKDFDDALSFTALENGGGELGVHIADVAHYVHRHTPLDVEAFLRGNSTYFPGTCVPMLPEALSNGLCSLRPKVVRLTVSVFVTFDAQGNEVSYRIARSFIKSACRFTYKEAKAVLDGKKRSKHSLLLKHLERLCILLRKQKAARGSIDFSLPEHVISVDAHGVPIGMHVEEYDITHQLVEECMLKANETVAKELVDRAIPLIFRVHDAPLEETLNDFYDLARQWGFSLPADPTAADLQAMFRASKSTPFYQQLVISFIRSMKMAQYSTQNVGHFGLALENYCHFTSPIRRYSDLIIQRLLFHESIDKKRLDAVALRCSEQERVSFKAESRVKILKKLRLLQADLEKKESSLYHGVISKIKPFGICFSVDPFALEGFLHVSELPDYFIYDAKRQLLVGKRTGLCYKMGAKISIELVGVDLILQEARWRLAAATDQS